jgi:c-di-GMP-binding flagellar brake protein YcgR
MSENTEGHNKSSEAERRRGDRVRADFTLTYSIRRPSLLNIAIGEKQLEGVMLDLSENGMAIQTAKNVPVKKKVRMHFTLVNPVATSMDDRIKEMQISGEVKYNRILEPGKYRLGICFVKITKKDKDIIADYVSTVIKHNPR